MKKLKYLVLIITLFLVVNKISAEGLPAGEYKVGDLVTLLKEKPLNATM